MYSVSVNDTKDLLDQCVLKSTAVIQKVSSLEQYANHLRRERDLLQREVTDLKRQKETQEKEDMLLQSDDDDDDDDVFSLFCFCFDSCLTSR